MATQDENKKSNTNKNPRQTPEESGEIKGPMGVGGIKEPDTQAKLKKPSKGTGPDRDKKSNGSEKSTGPHLEMLNPELTPEKKALPERTTETEEHLVVKPGSDTEKKKGKSREKKISPMHEKNNSPIILGEATNTEEGDLPSSRQAETPEKVRGKKKRVTRPLTDKVDAKEVKEKIRERKRKTAELKAESSSAKKMPRRKPVDGISAEEKAEIPDATIMEELKSTARDTTKKILDKIKPDEETQEELKEMTKSVLPDRKDIDNFADRIKKNLPSEK